MVNRPHPRAGEHPTNGADQSLDSAHHSVTVLGNPLRPGLLLGDMGDLLWSLDVGDTRTDQGSQAGLFHSCKRIVYGWSSSMPTSNANALPASRASAAGSWTSCSFGTHTS